MTEALNEGGSSSAGCGILLTQENTIISVVQKQVCGRQYESGSKLECLASYHAFVSRLARIKSIALEQLDL
jgi:hypothetical protein